MEIHVCLSLFQEMIVIHVLLYVNNASAHYLHTYTWTNMSYILKNISRQTHKAQDTWMPRLGQQSRYFTQIHNNNNMSSNLPIQTIIMTVKKAVCMCLPFC